MFRLSIFLKPFYNNFQADPNSNLPFLTILLDIWKEERLGIF